jgi:hypothetical protein
MKEMTTMNKQDLSDQPNAGDLQSAQVVTRPPAHPDHDGAWIRTAIEANKTLDAYLRSINPQLPEHYGMPVDGVRQTVEAVMARMSLDVDRQTFLDATAIQMMPSMLPMCVTKQTGLAAPNGQQQVTGSVNFKQAAMLAYQAAANLYDYRTHLRSTKTETK